MKTNMLKNLFCLFCYRVCSLVNVVLGWFGVGKDCHGDNTMQSGELIVTGKEEVEIPLRNFPSYVKVTFKDHCIVVPCNPQNFDELEWEVIKHCHKDHYKLHIKWNVTGVREIVWTVYF